MRNRFFLMQSVAYLFLMNLVACNPKSSSEPIGYEPPKPKDDLPLVDHPEYVHWAQFPVDTFVVRKKTVTNENGSVYVTTTVRLADKSEEQVVVEQQVTVERPEGTQENEPIFLKYPAQFRLPENVELERFSMPSLKAEKTGTETFKVGDQQFEATIYEWEEVNEAGPMTVKLWRSEEVPGRLLKEETLIIRDGDTSLEEIAELHVAEKTGEKA